MKRMCLALGLLIGGVASTATADYVLIVADLGRSGSFSRQGQGAVAGAPPQMQQPAAPAQPGGTFVGGQPGGFAGAPPGGPPSAPPDQPVGPAKRPVSAEFDPDTVPLMILAVIEVERKISQKDIVNLVLGRPIGYPLASLVPFKIAGLDGKIYLSNTSFSTVVVLHPNGKPSPPLQDVYAAKVKALNESKTPPGADQWIELAEWSLGHGMLDHFTQHMEKAVSADKANPKVAAYLQMKAALAKPVENVDTAGPWRKQLLTPRYETTRSAHYALLSNDKPAAEARLHRLEDALQSYYYWFAIHGLQLPVPTQPLVAILTSEEKEFKHLHNVFDSTPVVSDAFYARRENIVVFSSRRLDDAYDRVDKMAAPLKGQGYTFELMLKGSTKGFPRLARPVDKLEATTLALLLRVMELDGEVAGTGHGATRQLIYSSGLLPPAVAAPEWIQFGVSSFCTTSPGSPWPTFGLPSFEYGPLFKDLLTLKKLPTDKLELLKEVVTDGFFRYPTQGVKKDAALRNARAAAWSLTHYLLRKRLDGVQRYFKELSQLPRDLALDEQTLWLAFARAFNAVDAAGQPDPNVLREIADDWDKDLQLDHYDNREIELMREIRLAYKEAVRSHSASMPAAQQAQFGTNPAAGANPGFRGGLGGVRRPGGN
jgi:hypothetical protein